MRQPPSSLPAPPDCNRRARKTAPATCLLLRPTSSLARRINPNTRERGGLSSERISDANLYSAAQLVAALPRTQARSRAGVPLLFDAEALEAAIATISPSCLSLRARRNSQLFELVFTDHALSTLLPSYDPAYEDRETPQMATPGLTAVDEALVAEAVAALIADLNVEQALVLRLKCAEVSDLELGKRLAFRGQLRPNASERCRRCSGGTSTGSTRKSRTLSWRACYCAWRSPRWITMADVPPWLLDSR